MLSRSVVLTLILSSFLTLPCNAAEKDPKAKARYLRVLRASLLVVIPSQTGTFQGTGVLVEARRRLVITNYHVVQEHDDVLLYFPAFISGRLLTDREVYRKAIRKRMGIKGRVLARDKKRDLALIQLSRIPRGVKSLRLARVSSKGAERVHTIGNPGSSPKLWRYTARKVERVERARFLATGGPGSKFRMEVSARMVFTDTPSKKGESGGPLFNDKAELVGITQGFIPTSGTGLFVDISELWQFLVNSKVIKKNPMKTVD